MPSQDQVTPPPTPAVAFSDRDHPDRYDEAGRPVDGTGADTDPDTVTETDTDGDNVPDTDTDTDSEDAPDTETETAPVAVEPSTSESFASEASTAEPSTADYEDVRTDDEAPLTHDAVPVDDAARADDEVSVADAPPAVESATYQGSSYQDTSDEGVADVDPAASERPVDDESDGSLTGPPSGDPVLVDRSAAEPLADPDSSDSSTAAGVAYIPPQPGSTDSNGTEASPTDDGLAGSDVETVPDAAILAEEPALGERTGSAEATAEDSTGAPVDAALEDSTEDSDEVSTEVPADAPIVVPDDAANAPVESADVPVESADAPVEDGDEVELSPGDVALNPVAGLWPDDAAEALRQRWRELQLRFVDDPQNAAAEADFLVGEAIETLTGSLASLRTDLSSWRSEGAGDTERLRVAVQRYREFLDRILGL